MREGKEGWKGSMEGRRDKKEGMERGGIKGVFGGRRDKKDRVWRGGRMKRRVWRGGVMKRRGMEERRDG